MKFAVLDFETTGTQSSDAIIQIGLSVIDHDLEIVETYQSLVNPGVPLPPFISELTGIVAEQLEQAPVLDEAIIGMIPLLDDAVLIGHNVAFDFGFLQRALDQTGYLPFTGRILDTIDLLRILYPSITGYQLGAVAAQFGIEHERPHQADSDALATAHVFLHCLEEARSLPLVTLQRVAELLAGDDDLGWFFHTLVEEKELEPLHESGEFKYYRQFALKTGEWSEVPPAREIRDGNPLENVPFEDFLQQVQDNLRAELPGYEEREAQNMMFAKVEEAFSADKHLLIEAGTGTGKSLGYLIPAIYESVKHDRKVMVSTHTINLQEQLRERDVPLLSRVVPFEFRASVFKGRRHYLCLRKLEQKIERREFAHPADDALTAAQLVVWLTKTESGDDEELNLGIGRGQDFWDTIASETDSCLGRACPWFRSCYYYRAKHEATMADVVVTNHSKLFSDVKADDQLLPAYERLVIDEAHHLEDVAGKHLGLRLNYFSFVHAMTRLYKDGKNGQLPALRQLLSRAGGEKAGDWVRAIDEIVPELIDAKESWDKLTELLYTLLPDRTDASAPEAGQHTLRLTAGEYPGGWDTLSGVENQIYVGLGEVIRRAERMAASVKEDSGDYTAEGIATDIAGLIKDLSEARESLRFFMRLDDGSTVYWLEGSTQFKSKSIQLYAVPIDVSGQLQQHFFDKKKSIVLTSATLAVDKKFDYMIDQLGLRDAASQKRLLTEVLPSPFNYREQALLIVPRDFPSVKGQTADARFLAALTDSLASTAEATQGRMLVLFTSYRMLRQVYDPLKEMLAASGISLIGQGVDSGSRSRLTRRFQDSPRSVLLGTSSFWEGVDIPGDALTCLAIVRLPFQPPSHPLLEAKSELLKRQNLNPFMKLSVPQAVIRFKQGFGRLVRTRRDRGIVIVYDTRVIESYYGKYFLYSLPGPKMEHMALEQIVPRVAEWLGPEEKTD
ncbi:ATP-dependent DNA helicase DinG [Saccharibacillus sp. CPCC 101409]|uniref:ATP-dependent DNA helicase DinG n=1 Tax=Saccharibacillus sp. CPCC 101409 TaxID=3058041 RepID=UPI002672F8B4|nr:ATP-dependent DNA helicase DinG [Saccharibacillus sp. CPCC 101409]MDO3409643.1 ATP-dependent DNA helicase DinG [Saccharibacillus sp. CPCC 101409]